MVRIGITSGMRGYFAYKYDDNGPITTSPFTSKNWPDAKKDAILWAQSEFGEDWQQHCDIEEN